MRAAIQLLPDELLGLFFTCCLPIIPTFKPRSAPLLLTQICSRWRTVALATPALWAQISIQKEAYNLRDMLSLLDAWLMRSRATPVHVMIDSQMVGGGYCSPLSHILIGRLHSLRHRLRSLNACLDISDMATLPFSDMVFLEQCRLYHPHDKSSASYTDRPSLKIVSLPRYLPQLRTLRLAVAADCRSLQAQTRLSELSLEWLTLGDAYSLLASLPCLETAIFTVTQLETETDNLRLSPNASRIELPALRELILVCANKQLIIDPGVVLDRFSTPNLKELRLHFYCGGRTESEFLRSFVVASRGSCLERLVVSVLDGIITNVDVFLLDILRASPALRFLTCSRVLVRAEVLRLLAWTEDSDLLGDPDQRLAPHLETLFLSFCCASFSDADLLNVLRSRSHVLRNVYLSFNQGMRRESELEYYALDIERVVLSYH